MVVKINLNYQLYTSGFTNLHFSKKNVFKCLVVDVLQLKLRKWVLELISKVLDCNLL